MDSPATTHDRRHTRTAPRSALPVFVTCWLALLADGYDLYVYGATLCMSTAPRCRVSSARRTGG